MSLKIIIVSYSSSNTAPSASLETQGRSVRSVASHAGVFRGARISSHPTEGRNTSSPKKACVGGYQIGRTASKVLKNGRESPQDAILNEPVLRLIRMLVSDWAQKYVGGKHLSLCFCDFLIRRSLPANSTVLPYLSGSCVGAFFEKNFSVKLGPTKPKISHNLACKVRFPYNCI